MKQNPPPPPVLPIVVVLVLVAAAAAGTEPCGDFGECKALVEINASDGDIGFHFLMDGDDLTMGRINGPDGAKVFEDQAKGALKLQGLTETFVESAEPLCWEDPDADPDDEIVTLEEFVGRWGAGTYTFSGTSTQGEKSEGTTQLTHELPAAPVDLHFDGTVITWSAGDDLGRCGSFVELNALVATGVLPVHPADVPVVAWEVVLEPNVEDGDPTGKLVFSIRVPGNVAVKQVTVPADYLASLPNDTAVKIEVGAIGLDDNATFSETSGFCVNEVEGCEEE